MHRENAAAILLLLTNIGKWGETRDRVVEATTSARVSLAISEFYEGTRNSVTDSRFNTFAIKTRSLHISTAALPVFRAPNSQIAMSNGIEVKLDSEDKSLAMETVSYLKLLSSFPPIVGFHSPGRLGLRVPIISSEPQRISSSKG